MANLVTKRKIVEFSVKELTGIDLPMGDVMVKGFSEPGRHTPKLDSTYVWNIDVLMAVVNMMLNPTAPLLLIGERGSGKTAAIRVICALLNLDFYLLAHNEQTKATQPIFTVDVVVDEDGKQVTKTIDGALVSAYTEGGIFCADEITRARPGVTVAYNSVLDRVSVLHNRYGKQLVKHAMFRFAATANTAFASKAKGAYSASQQGDASTDDRFRVQVVPYVDADAELEVIHRHIPELDEAGDTPWAISLIKMANDLRQAYVDRKFPVPISTRVLVSVCEDMMFNQSEQYAINWNIINKLSEPAYKVTVAEVFKLNFGHELRDLSAISSSLPRKA